MPFILRNVRLQGINSAYTPRRCRQTTWERLATTLPDSFYQQATYEISLEEVPATDAAQLGNDYKATGRTLVKIR